MIRLILLLWALPALATGWPQKILKQEKFPAPQGPASKQIQSIVYGNSDYGFFEQAVKQDGATVSVELFPPGYKKPIEFFAKTASGEGGLIPLGSRRYTSPFSEIGVQPQARLAGRFSFPFFIVTWFPTDEEPIPVIFNREGEPVWAISPRFDRRAVFTRGYLPSKTSAGNLVFIGGSQNMTFWNFNMKTGVGTVTEGPHGQVLHHAYQYLPETNELVALTYDCRPVRWWQETSPVFAGLSGWWNLLKLPRRSVMGSSLVRVNLASGALRKIWSTFDSFSYRSTPSLAMNSEMDRYQDIARPGEYQALKAQPAYKLKANGVECDSDWSHENSVRYYPGKGYLVSIRNFNKVLFLGENGKPLWSLGSGLDDTFRVEHPPERFSLQHDAWMTADNRVLMFDNHVPYRGWLDSRYFSQSRISEYELREGEGLRRWAMPLPEPRAEIRGSVEPLISGEVLAFDPGEYPRPLRLFQFEPAQTHAQASLELDYPKTYRAFKVRSLMSILDEKFLPEMGRPAAPPRIAFDAVIKEIESGY